MSNILFFLLSLLHLFICLTISAPLAARALWFDVMRCTCVHMEMDWSQAKWLHSYGNDRCRIFTVAGDLGGRRNWQGTMLQLHLIPPYCTADHRDF